jgi:hypothetical protein
LLVLAALACNLPGALRAATPPPEAEMTLAEALQVPPEDARPETLRLMGLPDSFTIEWQELEGVRVRWEEWSYYDQGTRFDFIDGELVWTIDIDPALDGSLFAHFYSPLEFDDGMPLAAVRSLLSDQELDEIPLDEADIPGGLILAGDQILLGFDAGALVTVQTLILAPTDEALALAQPTATQGPTTSPATTTVIAPSDFLLADDFESAGGAAALFGAEFMGFSYSGGAGELTARAAGVLPAMYAAPALGDFIAEVEIRSPSAAPGSSYGLVFRSEDPSGGLDHYYHVLLWPADGRISLDAWKDGGWALTEGGALPGGLATATGPNVLRLEARGSQFRVLVNGSLALEVQDAQIPGPGVLGLSISTTNFPETVYFDNLEVSEP